MRLRTVNAPTLAAAMSEVRHELGADALIVATETLADGSVRLTAAQEGAPAAPARAPADGERNGAPQADPLPLLRRAFASHAFDADMTLRLLSGAEAAIRLHGAPLAPAIALAAALDRSFAFAPIDTAPARPLALVGLPGAGKTVTAAKLVAAARLANRNALLITTDTVKAGGVAQARELAEAIGVECRIAAGPAELAHALSEISEDTLRVVDTTAVDPADPTERARLAALLRGVDAEAVLVLAAGMDADDAAEAGAAFAGLGCRRTLVTRLDLTRRMAGVLAALAAGPLAVAGVSVTPAIAPEEGGGLEPLNPVAMARLLLADIDTSLALAPVATAARSKVTQP